MMENQVAISVVVPVYNGERVIGRCLDSLCAQNFHDFEIVVVDDCSRDGSVDAVRRHAERNSRVRLVAKDVNQGTMEARRTGYENARGEYIVFCDCDDTMPHDALARMYDMIAPERLDMVLCGLRIIETDGSVKLRPRLRSRLDEGESIWPALLRSKITPYLCAGIYRREFLLDVAPETFCNQSVNEDFMMLLQLLNATERYSFENEYLYDYIIQPHSSSQGRPSLDKLRQELWANKWCCDYLCSHSICVDEARRLYLRRVVKCLPWGFSRAQIMATGLVDRTLFSIANIRRYAGIKYVLKYWWWTAVRTFRK